MTEKKNEPSPSSGEGSRGSFVTSGGWIKLVVLSNDLPPEKWVLDQGTYGRWMEMDFPSWGWLKTLLKLRISQTWGLTFTTTTNHAADQIKFSSVAV